MRHKKEYYTNLKNLRGVSIGRCYLTLSFKEGRELTCSESSKYEFYYFYVYRALIEGRLPLSPLLRDFLNLENELLDIDEVVKDCIKLYSEGALKKIFLCNDEVWSRLASFDYSNIEDD